MKFIVTVSLVSMTMRLTEHRDKFNFSFQMFLLDQLYLISAGV